jgi:regulatory protein
VVVTKSMQNKQPTGTAYEKAVKLLSMRMHTSYELKRKLKQKGFADDNIRLAIEKLTADGYLNDAQTAESYLHSLINHKTFGYYGIKAKMMQKGIDVKIVDMLIEENFPPDKEAEIATRYVTKNNLSGLKAATGLKRKGFRGQIVSKYFNDIE